MGCYTDTFAFLDRIGAADRVRWQSGLKVSMIDRQGRESTLALPSLPSPLHFLAGVMAWDALTLVRAIFGIEGRFSDQSA